MNDLDLMTGRSHGSLMRSARTGAALFGSGVVVGIVLALVFHALIYAAIIIAAIAIVLVAAARMALARRRP
jgi:Flp pilus assembly protein TadB